MNVMEHFEVIQVHIVCGISFAVANFTLHVQIL